MVDYLPPVGDADGFTAQLQALLPTGPAWPRSADATLTALIRAMADGLARCDARATMLLDELDPRVTFEMLTDWEAEAGLPDPCAGQPETLQERRAAVTAKITSRGGQTPAYFVELAASLGYPVTIEEHRQFRFGESSFGEPFMEDGWAYTWTVHAPEASEVRFRFGESSFGERFLDFGNQRLECAILRRKPAHTRVIFAYGG